MSDTCSRNYHRVDDPETPIDAEKGIFVACHTCVLDKTDFSILAVGLSVVCPASVLGESHSNVAGGKLFVVVSSFAVDMDSQRLQDIVLFAFDSVMNVKLVVASAVFVEIEGV